ncbi:hypothetical protein D4764_19G0002540 [Takifugu flavidus]|uniref:Uncharacterized protein n=1 Tax=Takifugu flavidus TaxID=433684 RepID=A0A5C6NN11_9TELE|nr:hypothetical protein D4764_19G0002540 [Takifugu flavidus]
MVKVLSTRKRNGWKGPHQVLQASHTSVMIAEGATWLDTSQFKSLLNNSSSSYSIHDNSLLQENIHVQQRLTLRTRSSTYLGGNQRVSPCEGGLLKAEHRPIALQLPYLF